MPASLLSPSRLALSVLMAVAAVPSSGSFAPSTPPADQVVAETLYEEAELGLAESDPGWSQTRSDPRVVCLPDASDPTAPRVEFVFVTSDPDAPLPRAEMLETAAWVDRVFADSASHHASGSFRAVRWHQQQVAADRCEPILRKVVTDPGPLQQWARSDGSWNRFRQEIYEALGADATSGPRRYLVWADMQHPGYCGHGEMPRDSRADPTLNTANGPDPRIAVVYRPCHGRFRSTEAHELVHSFGAVLPVAPNASQSHCTDHNDRMCVGPANEVACPGSAWRRLLDCGGDDYFHPEAELVDLHGRPFWNTADSAFLTDRAPGWWQPSRQSKQDPPESSPRDEERPRDGFADTSGHVFSREIHTLAASGVARGCNPPDDTRFCPQDIVTRGQMAAFLARALDLPAGDRAFADTEGTVFHSDISALAVAGITTGCGQGRFCPDQPVTRGQMAAFLARALDLPAGDRAFIDTEGHVFASDIAALASAGITRGCDPPENTEFCPDQPVTRGQMAAFLQRAGLAS